MSEKKGFDVNYAISFLRFLGGKVLLRRAFRKYAVPELRGEILDAGSALSPYSSMLKDSVTITSDIDPKSKADVHASCDKLPFEDGSFDGIICTEVLEHVPNPLECLVELSRVLKKGGTLYLTTPFMWRLHYEPHDYFRYTQFGLRHLLEKAGFTDIRIHPIGGYGTVVTQLGISGIGDFIERVLFMFPGKIRVLAVLAVVVPLQIISVIISIPFDFFSRRVFFDWAVIAKGPKKE